MKKKQHILFIIIFFFSIAYNANCAIKNDVSKIYSVNNFNNIKVLLKFKKFKQAIEKLEKMNFTHSNILNKNKIIYLIYAYYQTSNFNQSKKMINQFKQLYKKDTHIDYVLYIDSLINIEIDKYYILGSIPINIIDCDPTHSSNTLHELINFLNLYPKSKYANYIYQEATYLKNKLACYELGLVKFYFARKAYVAVINRVENMLKNFSDTLSVREALPYLQNAYESLDLKNAYNITSKIIKLNKYEDF